MRNILQTAAALVLCASAVTAAQAAPGQIVVVVADGLSPQVIDLGSSYVKKASTEEDATVAFDDLKSQGKIATVSATTASGTTASGTTASGDVLASMRGVLKTAAANGYKTGLVTTGDVTTDAALLYDLPADTKDVASALVNTTKPNFLGGGGRTKFDAALTKSFTGMGNTAITNAEEFESTDADAVKGNVLALENDNDLSYAIDHDSSTETAIGDLASLAMKTLGGDSNKPYVLIVHDTNIARALAAKDTPAVFGEFREIDGIVAEVLSTRSALDTPENMALAVVSTGAMSFPKYTTENVAERSNAIFITSQLNSSYAKATSTLKGATDDDMATFSTETFPGWKPSSSVRAKVMAGTMTGEDAVRASYEPTISLGYDATSVAPMAYVVGLDAGDVVKEVAAVASMKATTPAKTSSSTSTK